MNVSRGRSITRDYRSEQHKEQDLAGSPNARMNLQKARTRADDLVTRLQRRTEELKEERAISPLPPVVTGGAMVILIWVGP